MYRIKAAVCVSVIGKADVQPVFHYESLQVFNMGGTDVKVDIESVRAVADHIGIRAERIENRLGNGPGAAVRAVEADLYAAEIVYAKRNQITDITVTSGDIIDGCSDPVPAAKGSSL